MRYFPIALFAAGLAFALACPAQAAAGSINDCEKIEAADAYNQCLASFGPVAHTHGASAKDFGGDGVGGDAGAADAVVETANPEASVPENERQSSRGRHGKGHWTRHYHHQYYGHNYSRHHSAYETHGGSKRMAFSVVTGHTKMR